VVLVVAEVDGDATTYKKDTRYTYICLLRVLVRGYFASDDIRRKILCPPAT
jgi:hypothetical protein